MYPTINRQTAFRQLEITNNISDEELRNLIYQSIIRNSARVDLYTRLLNDAPNRFTAILLENIRLNEIDLLNRFKNFFIENYGPIPHFEMTPITYSSYKEGIEAALISEIQSVQLSRRIRESIAKDHPAYELYRSAAEIDFEHEDLLGTIYGLLE